MLLHTIQHEVVLDGLLSDGEWHPDPSTGEPDFADAYAWMHEQMTTRLGLKCRAAVWLWAKQTRASLVDSCRRAARTGEPSVLLTCRIPRERVVLSHFGDWHCVLNDWLHTPRLPDESVDEWRERTDPVTADFWAELGDARRKAGVSGHYPRSRWPQDLRRRVEASWAPIFLPQHHLALVGDRRQWSGDWQATTPWLLAADVVGAVRLERSGTTRRGG